MEANRYRSAEIDLLMGSMAKAQGTYKKLIPNEDGPRGKYANLDAIKEATREALSSNAIGLLFHQELLDEGVGASLLWTTLGHESGQFMASCERIVKDKIDVKTFNSIENHKRIHALMILGIAPSKNDPLAVDDGGIQQLEDVTLEKMKKPSDKKEFDYNDTVTKEQYQELLLELDGYPEVLEQMQLVYAITTLADLPKSEYHPALMKIRKIKRTHEDYAKKR